MGQEPCAPDKQYTLLGSDERIFGRLISIIAECPMCGENMEIPDHTELGDFVVCEECDREFEVVDLRPVELEWIDDYEDADYQEHMDESRDDKSVQ